MAICFQGTRKLSHITLSVGLHFVNIVAPTIGTQMMYERIVNRLCFLTERNYLFRKEYNLVFTCDISPECNSSARQFAVSFKSRVK